MDARDQRIAKLKMEFTNPEHAYQYIDAIRSGVNVGAFGLGAADRIPSNTSLLIGMTVEGFCTLLALLTFISELVNVIDARMTGVISKADGGFLCGHSLYLGFRASCILASATGIALIASDFPLPNPQNTTQSDALSTGGYKTTAGVF